MSEVRAALDALRRIVQVLRAAGRDSERRTGVTSAQLFALQQIAEHPKASINDVAALTYTHQSSVSIVIQRLVAQRLVAKVAASHDRRRQCLALTSVGRRILQRAPTSVQERLVVAISSLSATDRRVLARSLRDIAWLVAPRSSALHPPMMFEESVRNHGGGQRPRRRQGR